MSPQRIQRKRTKGWRMPEGAVYVGRPAGWGNPFRIGQPFRFIAEGPTLYVGVVRSQKHAVELFRSYLAANPDLRAKVRAELAGKDLVCWCDPFDPCHADVLLKIANGGES